MGLRERFRRGLGRRSEAPSKATENRRAKRAAASPRGPAPGRDWLSKAVRVLVLGLVELLRLAREMLVIPVQLWLYVAEIAGAAVLRVWRLLVFPLLRAAWRLLRAGLRLAQQHVTPARAVAAVAVAAAIGLAASQWLDYRSVTVGNDAYSGGVEAVAPAPDVARDRAGEAHAWVMVPLAAAAIVCVLVALAGRARAARLLLVIGIAAIAISVIVDAPKGLDEGAAARNYEGAEARLLDGFWAQIAAGGVLAACGLLLPAYLRPARGGAATENKEAKGDSTASSLLRPPKGRLRMPSKPKLGRPKPSPPKPSPPKGSSA